MGVATTYNPGSMSRSNAILLLVLALVASPAFSADPPGGTTLPDEIDPATGLARSTVVRPYSDSAAAPAPPGAPAAPAEGRPATPRPIARRPHVALILPTASPALGKLAEAVRAGFMAAVDAAGRESIPVNVTAVDNEATALIEACRYSQAAGDARVLGGDDVRVGKRLQRSMGDIAEIPDRSRHHI